MFRSGATAQVSCRQFIGLFEQLRNGHSSTCAGIWDMTCNLKPQPEGRSLVTLLSILVPLGILALTVIVTALVCWRFGSALGRQWEAIRVARLKRK